MGSTVTRASGQQAPAESLALGDSRLCPQGETNRAWPQGQRSAAREQTPSEVEVLW